MLRDDRERATSFGGLPKDVMPEVRILRKNAEGSGGERREKGRKGKARKGRRRVIRYKARIVKRARAVKNGKKTLTL